MVIEAGSLLLVGGYTSLAGSDGKEPPYELHTLPDSTHIDIGSKVSGSILLYLPHDLYTWIVLLDTDADMGICLVILQQDIVFRPVFLDQGVLEN